MKNAPEEVRTIIETAATRHPNDVMAAIEEAMSLLVRLPNYAELVTSLVRNCVQEMIYDHRHIVNTAFKRSIGYYGGPPKVSIGSSEEVLRAYKSVYAYHMAGRTLGELTLEDMPEIEKHEEEVARGHLFNARLVTWLRTVTRPGKKVCQCIPEKLLRQNFNRIWREVYGNNAA